MAATLLAPPTEMIHLPGICWQSYEALLEKLVNRTLVIEWFKKGDRFLDANDRTLVIEWFEGGDRALYDWGAQARH
ncbi:MAG: hypothetical protein RBJ76_01890 [Stenomitos frigidus ULC029]